MADKVVEKDVKKVESKENALVKQDPNGVVKLNMDAFDQATKQQVSGLIAELQTNMQEFATSALKIGSTLSRAKALLEPKRCFQAFVNSVPGMSIATAYRYIARFENANKLLPEPVIKQAIAAGLDMVSSNPDNPFGSYSEAVKKVGIPTGNVSDTKARQFIEDVVTEKRILDKKERKEISKDLPQVNLSKAFRSVVQNYHRLPKDKQSVKWVSELFSHVLGELGFTAHMTITPSAQNEIPAQIRTGMDKKKAGRPRKESKSDTPAESSDKDKSAKKGKS